MALDHRTRRVSERLCFAALPVRTALISSPEYRRALHRLSPTTSQHRDMASSVFTPPPPAVDTKSRPSRLTRALAWRARVTEVKLNELQAVSKAGAGVGERGRCPPIDILVRQGPPPMSIHGQRRFTSVIVGTCTSRVDFLRGLLKKAFRRGRCLLSFSRIWHPPAFPYLTIYERGRISVADTRLLPCLAFDNRCERAKITGSSIPKQQT